MINNSIIIIIIIVCGSVHFENIIQEIDHLWILHKLSFFLI